MVPNLEISEHRLWIRCKLALVSLDLSYDRTITQLHNLRRRESQYGNHLKQRWKWWGKRNEKNVEEDEEEREGEEEKKAVWKRIRAKRRGSGLSNQVRGGPSDQRDYDHRN